MNGKHFPDSSNLNKQPKRSKKTYNATDLYTMLCEVIVMTKYRLNYANLDLKENDIPCYEFDNKYKMLDFVRNVFDNNILTYLDKVVLVAISDHLIVVRSMDRVLKFIYDELNELDFGVDVFLQEYSSYEEAYEVALNMMCVIHKSFNN